MTRGDGLIPRRFDRAPEQQIPPGKYVRPFIAHDGRGGFRMEDEICDERFRELDALTTKEALIKAGESVRGPKTSAYNRSLVGQRGWLTRFRKKTDTGGSE